MPLQLCCGLGCYPEIIGMRCHRTSPWTFLARMERQLNPEAKKTLQGIGNQYVQKAEVRRIEIIRPVFPNDNKVE